MNASITKNELTRSTTDAVVTGVCGGLAKRFSMESWIVRVALVLSILLAGFGFFVYIILAFSIPKDTEVSEAYNSKILGVCLRISKKYGWEVGIVRAVFASSLLLSLIPSFGTTLIIYFLMHFFLPANNSGVVDVEAKDIN